MTISLQFVDQGAVTASIILGEVNSKIVRWAW